METALQVRGVSAVATGTLCYHGNKEDDTTRCLHSLPETEAVGEKLYIIHEASVIH